MTILQAFRPDLSLIPPRVSDTQHTRRLKMEHKAVLAIIEAANTIGDINAKIYENYSGRGMYGKQTTGITIDGDISQLLQAVAYAAHNITIAVQEAENRPLEDDTPDYTQDTPDDPNTYNDIDYFINDLRNIRSDSLGLGTIYY